MSKSILNLDPVNSEKDIIIHFDEKSQIPLELIGKYYIRNGGNEYIKNVDNHLFDGDGMIHCIEFKKNEIVYHNRWIKTYRYNLAY